ncbi:hypothetical protein JB92DRAFT_2836032 [Gautieria morchelliformis]|nr:hypothetical protein JB92DRAFT_2836032 [Gautieria morchelliformis]
MTIPSSLLVFIQLSSSQGGQASLPVAEAAPTVSQAPILEPPTPGPSILVRKPHVWGKKTDASRSMRVTPPAKDKKRANMNGTPPPVPMNKYQKPTDEFAELTAKRDARLLALQRPTLDWQEWQQEMKKYLEWIV